MTKSDALKLIDEHKRNNKPFIDPLEMLHWTWLRVIVLHVEDNAWDEAMMKACEVLMR